MAFPIGNEEFTKKFLNDRKETLKTIMRKETVASLAQG